MLLFEVRNVGFRKARNITSQVHKKWYTALPQEMINSIQERIEILRDCIIELF
jgi:hypothetical protein